MARTSRSTPRPFDLTTAGLEFDSVQVKSGISVAEFEAASCSAGDVGDHGDNGEGGHADNGSQSGGAGGDEDHSGTIGRETAENGGQTSDVADVEAHQGNGRTGQGAVIGVDQRGAVGTSSQGAEAYRGAPSQESASGYLPATDAEDKLTAVAAGALVLLGIGGALLLRRRFSST